MRGRRVFGAGVLTVLLGLAAGASAFAADGAAGAAGTTGTDADAQRARQLVRQLARELRARDARLNEAADALLERLRELRARELEAMRGDVLATVRDWDSGAADLDGQSLRTAVRKARAVAEGYGLDVAALEAMFEATKRMIRRLEFASLCGSGLGLGTQLAEGAGGGDGVAADALRWFGLADREEERLACAQEKRLLLYRNTARAYVLALGAPDAATSARGFRDYLENVRAINDSEALAIAADCERLAAQQELVAETAGLVPALGDALDILAVAQGEDLAGRKLTALDSLTRVVMLLTPEVLTQVAKRHPEALPRLAEALRSLAAPRGGAVDALLERTGGAAAALRARAGELLASLGESGAGKALARAKDAAAETLAEVAVADVTGAVARIRSLHFVGDAAANTPAARRAAHMPEQWLDALAEAAGSRNEIILVRPVNEHARAWLDSGLAVGKGMHVKGKTATRGPLAGLIPVDQGMSKLTDPQALERAAEAHLAALEREAATQGRQVAREALEREARDRAAREAAGRVEAANRQVAACMEEGYARSVPLVVDGNGVVRVRDAAGAEHALLKTPDGRYLDPDTGQETALDLARGTEQEVRVLADPHSGKLLTADADLFGVGTARTADGPAVRTSSEAGAGAGAGAGTGAETGTDPDFDPAVWGSVSKAEMDTAFEVNAQGRLLGANDRILQHGPAVRHHELPDFPLTMFLPDRSVVTIRNEEQLRQVMSSARRNGVRGLEPNPAWGWGDEWWRE
ncbi:MAG: hypothetical protein H0S85_12485 [Desulfovibrionaceae bacterium]|nr:hypothetical protein [Desulfovibrionaceae bacterium]